MGTLVGMREIKPRTSKLAAVGTTLACALAFAGLAEAKTREFSGPIGPSGAISFSLKGKGDRAKVMDLRWFRLPVDCGRSEDTSSGSLSYKISVNDKRFKADAVLGNPKRPKAEAVIRGKIKGKDASGSILVRGSKLPISGGKTDDCESGKHPWNAAR